MLLPVLLVAAMAAFVGWVFEPAYQFHQEDNMHHLREGEHYTTTGSVTTLISQH